MNMISQPFSKSQEWGRLLDLQAESGDNIEDFCRNKQLNKATFYYWKRKLRGKEGPEPKAGFVQLELPMGPSAPQTGQPLAEIGYPDGRVVRIYAHTPQWLLDRLLPC